MTDVEADGRAGRGPHGSERAGPEDRVIPDLERLRLDTLLRELVDRASAVIDSEGRIHRLLDSVISITSDLHLPDVLRRIVECACDLVGARYGALGIVGPDGKVVEFITVGLDDVHRAQVGPEPTGKGILGLIIDQQRPLRLSDLTNHPGSSGFPPNHPPMRTFLGVPLRVRGQAFGNLYLTEKQGGVDFTPEDQEVVTALAAAAGIAIDNARLYEQTHQREIWLQAANEIAAALLSGRDPNEALSLVASRARELAAVPFAGVAARTGDDAVLRFTVADGPGSGRLVGREIDIADTVLGRTMWTKRPQVLADAGRNPESWLGDPDSELPTELKELGPAVMLPLSAAEDVIGVLMVARHQGAMPFSAAEVQMVQSFAGHAALAIEFNRAQEDRQRLAVFRDRDRIARDLHDVVIQRLFAIGLGLQGMSRLVVRPVVSDRLGGFVADLDQTIRDIRRSIFSLQEPPDSAGLRAQLLQIVEESADALGFEPDVNFTGPLDSLVHRDIGADMLATVREALSNVARHAQAGDVRVDVGVDPQGRRLNLLVADDGIGVPEQPTRSSGLTNMMTRATRWGGEFSIGPGSAHGSPNGGTRVDWSVPLTMTEASAH